jgi:ubiquinone/menaquinone biosynthesis C-methylase UbiE
MLMGADERSPQEQTYFIDPDTGAETARLIDQDRFITQNMGGLFPASLELSSIADVLDVACGPGGWAREVAATYPTMQVVGIDNDRSIIAYAHAYVRVQRLQNIQFRVMNALEPLAFEDETFDCVNARFLVGFLSRTAWPVLVQELARVTYPGGIIRLTEADDGGQTTSPAFAEIKQLLARAFYQAGRSFEPDGPFFGVTARLRTFLREAGLQDIHEQEHHLDFSAGAPAYASNYNNYRIGYKLLQPFLVKAGVTTSHAYEMLYNQMLEDMLAPTFQGHCTYLSVWGTKPLPDAPTVSSS